MPGLKRSRAEDAPEAPSASKKSKDKKPRKNDEAVKPKTSALAAQEVDFPRGGGSGLTPLEFREAKREARVESAANELLFKDAKDEQAEAKRKKNKQKANREKRNDAKKKRDTAPKAQEATEKKEHNRIEHINYKRLVPGSRLLCSVLAVHPVAVVVSLPNQMLGHIPATQISPQFTQRLQMAADAAAEDDDEESESSSDEDETSKEPKIDPKAVPELNHLFHVGQWLSATVLQVHSGDVAKGKSSREGGEYEKESRRVVLTLAPQVVNTGVSLPDLDVGSTLSTTIASSEDHGYMLDSGLPEFKGFMSYKDAAKLPAEFQAGKNGKGLQVGRVVYAKITKVPENRRSFEASLDPKAVSSSVIKHVPGITAILPGTLTKVLVTAAQPTGLNVKLFGMFDATIDRFHLPEIPEDKDISDVYKEGSKHVARVLWDLLAPASTALQGDNPDSERKLALSLAPQVLSLRPPLAATGELLQLKYPIGAAVQVTVVQTISDWGLVTLIKDTDLQGFVHISQVSDDHVVALPPSTGAYRKGTTHAARVIGHSPTDRVLQLSLKASTLDKKFMRVSEVEVGQVVTANILKLGLPNAIFLQLNGNVDGVVFSNHFADIKLTQPEKRFKPGLQVKARVMDVDPSRNRIVLTCKKSLVRSELPIIASMQDARVGVITHATVFRVLVNSVIVSLFGGLKALIPGREVSESNFEAVKADYTEGKVVKMRITEVDEENSRIVGSIRQSSAEYLAKLNVDAVEVGQKVSATVAAVHKEVVVLTLVPSGVRALVSLSTLATMRKTTPEALQEALNENEAVEDLVVSAKNPEKGLVICSSKVRSDRTKDATASGSTEAVTEGTIVKGRVIQQNQKYLDCVVAIGSTTRATLSITDVADEFDSAVKLPAAGSTVDCYVVSIKSNGKSAIVSTRPSRVSAVADAQVVDPEVTTAKDVVKGQKIRGYVKAITNVGLFVTIGRKVDARVQVREMFDEFVKEWKGKFTVGQVVSGTVMDVNVHQNEVELSLKSKPGSIPGKKAENGEQKAGPKRLWDFKAGDKVKGFVKNIVDFGVFVQIEGTTVSGLCHMKELSDGKPEEALRAFHVGDKVRAIVLKINEEKKTISFGLKPSYFDAADFEDSDSDDDSEEDDEDEEEDDEEASEAGDDEDAVDGADSIDEDESDDEEDFVQMDEDSDDDESDDADAVQPAKASAEKKAPPVLALSGGFSWSAGADEGSDDESSTASDSDSDEDEAATPAKTTKKAKKATKSNLEEDLTADLATKAPSSATDFERLLLGSPNSSFLWIQFMSFALQLSDVEQAREVAKRALKVISYREDQERMNVWIALLNLENTYGSEDTLDATFKEAVLANDGFTMYLKMVDIMEQSSKLDEAEELFGKAKAKYSVQPEFWIEFARFYLRTGQADKARGLLPRAMQALPKREHVLLITSMAIAEFKLGDPERGRTVFEGLVDSYPKRLDLWWQYLDQESRLADNHSHTRNLFERALTLKLTAKKGKSLLKKWLEYEKRHGDAKSQAKVLKKAKDFVEEMNAKNQEEDDEDEDDN